MADPIETICNLAGCSREDAERVYSEVNDIVEAVDKLLVKVSSPADKYIKKRKREVTPEEEVIAPIRKVMKQFDDRMSTALGQRGHEGSVEMLAPREETAQQNNCSQQCQLPSLEEAAQRQGIAYQ
jgi:ElaB/YqjD/DUF883 family membrane-anchored ribosome-binding protein